jgi:hypothetical protein
MAFEPFSVAALNEIFKLSQRNPNCLNTRESTRLEFKKSFHWGSGAEYGRTCAAFANREGGYMIFGVDKKPHRIVGLQGKAFEEIDPERVSKTLNEYFAPEIRWDMHIHEFMNLSFGILYVYQSSEKPVICCKTGEEVKEGQIYYRYSGRTQSIRYPELRQLIEERRVREQLLWLKHVKKIARVGVRDAAILDLKTGITSGANGSFLIDESLLPQLHFIREGEFDEKRGAPAVKIIGKAEFIGQTGGLPARHVARSQAIRTPDIIQAFLDNRPIQEPIEYLTQACFESSAYLPVYFLIKKAQLTLEKAIKHVNSVKSTQASKAKILARLSGPDDSLAQPLPVDSNERGRDKIETRNSLLDGSLQLAKDAKTAMIQVSLIRTLGAEEVRLPSVWAFCKHAYEKFFGVDPGVSGALRYSISHMDRVLNRPAVELPQVQNKAQAKRIVAAKAPHVEQAIS